MMKVVILKSFDAYFLIWRTHEDFRRMDSSASHRVAVLLLDLYQSFRLRTERRHNIIAGTSRSCAATSSRSAAAAAASSSATVAVAASCATAATVAAAGQIGWSATTCCRGSSEGRTQRRVAIVPVATARGIVQSHRST
jgi:hypothetical protein